MLGELTELYLLLDLSGGELRLLLLLLIRDHPLLWDESLEIHLLLMLLLLELCELLLLLSGKVHLLLLRSHLGQLYRV